MFKFFDTDQESEIFLTLDSGSGMEKFGSRIRDKQPGSATLDLTKRFFQLLKVSQG
jgi:hypothetical protein